MIYRKDMERPLSSDEMDGNFQELAKKILALEQVIQELSSKLNDIVAK